MGNKNSHDFTTGTSRNSSFDVSISKPRVKKSYDSSLSQPHSLASKSPDLSSRSYNTKSLGPDHRANSLGSLNTNHAVSYSKPAAPPSSKVRPTSATVGFNRQSSSQSAVATRPASVAIARQASSQPALSHQTSSQLSTPRQYSDTYLTDDLKKLYKAHDKSKARALVEDIDPHDTSAQALDRKLNALKNQRQPEMITETRSANGIVQKKNRNKAKAPQAPLQPPASTVTYPAANGKTKNKKKSAPAPPEQISEEPLPPPPPSPPVTPTPSIEHSPKQVINDNNNNNNSSSRTASAEMAVEMKTTLAPTVSASNLKHPLADTVAAHEVDEPTPQNTDPVPVPKKRMKKAPSPPRLSESQAKGPSTIDLELDTADDFIKAISTKTEQKEISIQCNIPIEQNNESGKENAVIDKSSAGEQEVPGDILKLYINKNAERDSHRTPDASSPNTEEPEQPDRKQKVVELDEVLAQTDEMIRPVLLNHKELTISLQDMDANSVTTEASDIPESTAKEDFMTPRPEIGVSDEKVAEPPIQSWDSRCLEKEIEPNKEEQSAQEAAIDVVKEEKEDEPTQDVAGHVEQQKLQPSSADEPSINQAVEVVTPKQDQDVHSIPLPSPSSAQLSPHRHYIDSLEQDAPSPTQSDQSRKKVKKHKSFSKLSKSVKNFMSSLGKSSRKDPKQSVTDKYGDDLQQEEDETELELSNDNWVFSSKGAIKPVARPEYNPAWVDETFRQPQSPQEPDQEDIEGQIDKLMEGAVDLSDNDQSDDTQTPATDGEIIAATVAKAIRTESLPIDNSSVINDREEASTTMTEPGINKANNVNTECANNNSDDAPTLTERVENESITDQELKVEIRSALAQNGNVRTQNNEIKENGAVNGWNDASNSTTDNVPAATKDSPPRKQEANGGEAVVFRAKLATIVTAEAEKLVKASAGDTADVGDAAPIPTSQPAIRNRSSIAFMTPKGYGETSSTYRRIDKSRLSNPGA